MIRGLWALLCRMMLVMACFGLASGCAAMAMRFPHAGVAILFLLLWGRLRRPHVSTDYGSATVSGVADLQRRGMLESDGLVLGRTLAEPVPKWAGLVGLVSPTAGSDAAVRSFLAAYAGRWWLDGRLIKLRKHVHLCTFGPAGSGKGVSVLIPNLLSYRGSCVVIDPKGELAKLTGKFRRKAFGQAVVLLNPFNVGKLGSGSWNPLDTIDHEADDFLDQVKDLANMLVNRTEREADPHWNDSCELVLTAAIAFVCGCEKDRSQRNFQTMRAILSSRHAFNRAVEIMQQHVDTCQGVIFRLGGQLTWFQDKELGSVLTTVQRHTNFLDSPLVAKNTSSSSFDPMILRAGRSWLGRKKNATIYLILPAERLASLASLQRMWIGTIMRAITRGTPTERNPVLWLLDEYAHIGAVHAITDGVTLLRGMGMRLWFFLQSHEQMKTCFGDKAATVLDNIGTQQYLGITSFETAEAISKRIGDQTIAIRTGSRSKSSSHTSASGPGSNPSHSHSSSDTVNSSEIARRLLKPEEVLTLSKDLTIIFYENMSVCAAKRVVYYRDREFKRGRGGRQGGLGLAAGIAASLLLALSFAFTRVAATVASLPPIRAVPSGPAAYGGQSPVANRYVPRTHRHR